jgi:OOP family OmpA-OmpF porin
MTRHIFPARTTLARYWQRLLICPLALAGCSGTMPHDAGRSIAVAAEPETTVAKAPSGQKLPDPAAAMIDLRVINEGNIFFEPGSTAVDVAERAKLRRHADYLKAKRKETVTLIGHTSDAGSRSFNLATAELRVTAVSKLLKSYGVSARQIRPHSVIRERIPAACKSPDCSRMARRVELVY